MQCCPTIVHLRESWKRRRAQLLSITMKMITSTANVHLIQRTIPVLAVSTWEISRYTMLHHCHCQWQLPPATSTPSPSRVPAIPRAALGTSWTMCFPRFALHSPALSIYAWSNNCFLSHYRHRRYPHFRSGQMATVASSTRRRVVIWRKGTWVAGQCATPTITTNTSSRRAASVLCSAAQPIATRCTGQLYVIRQGNFKKVSKTAQFVAWWQ